MKKNYTYNNLVRFYNRSRRKLKALIVAGRNLRKQGIIERRIARLHRLLTGMQTALKMGAATATLATGMVLLQPTASNAQTFATAQTNPFGLTNVGTLSKPDFADLDNDGDLDMMSGEGSGDFFYFENTSIAAGVSEGQTPTMRVYPTMVADVVVLETPNATGQTFSVINMTGQLVLNGTMPTNRHSLNVELLPAGVYTVQLTDREGIRQVAKFVKQ
ncbi:MAG: T9SS type A sorting domain-containing protein [Flavobacteriales bacterium]|nr:T9SS type A sorting domain-containing protein [Flavobacteriales bacterium]